MRNVAPGKEMMCLAFRLPATIAYADDGPASKRPHVEGGEAAASATAGATAALPSSVDDVDD